MFAPGEKDRAGDGPFFEEGRCNNPIPLHQQKPVDVFKKPERLGGQAMSPAGLAMQVIKFFQGIQGTVHIDSDLIFFSLLNAGLGSFPESRKNILFICSKVQGMPQEKLVVGVFVVPLIASDFSVPAV
jgi:hypothetical protein